MQLFGSQGAFSQDLEWEERCMRWIWIVTFNVSFLFAAGSAQAQLDQIWNKVKKTAETSNVTGLGLSNDKIIAGLKEALTVSTANAVSSTGRPDGFLKNPAIKIPLPSGLDTVGKGMRIIGMGSQMDELEVAMNRAAEQAAPAAKQIFITAVTKMNFEDARKILSGNDTAATEYFKKQSSDQLTTAFTPIIHKAMEKVGVIERYQKVIQNSAAARLLGSQNFNLDKYVVGKSLDGLFYMLGEEEKKIRKNPAAQTTSLLKEVFGKKL
jgi:hypothetical protein